MRASSLVSALTLILTSSLGCSVDEVPDGLKRTPPGDGATVRYQIHTAPLESIPLPNDVLCFADPTSRTGLRLNVSTAAPTREQSRIRAKLNTLEGWGSFAPITVSFDLPKESPKQTALDLGNLRQRHQNDGYAFENDAVYLVNLRTGVPVPLELGAGSFRHTLRDKARYGVDDPRAAEPNLLWETADETVSPTTGRPDASRSEYEPRFDTDYDGVLDRPNLEDPAACGNQVKLKLGQVEDSVRDRCLADSLLSWYERETDTLILRPLLPLEEKTQYAVVLTDRLLDAAGNPVKSPFDFVYHPSQEDSVRTLRDHLRDTGLWRYFGDLGGTGLDRVAFVWTFTTAPIVEDLQILRDGLYSGGPLAFLGRDFPEEFTAANVAGVGDPQDAAGSGQQPEGWQELAECEGVADRPYLIKVDRLLPAFERLSFAELGLRSELQKRALLQSLQALDHLVLGSFTSPFLIKGGPDGAASYSSFDINLREGTGEIHSDTVQVWIAIPKETELYQQPFGVNFYAHRWSGSAMEILEVAGEMAMSGLATVAMNAPWHGPGPTEAERLQSLFAETCYVPAARQAARGRFRDLDGDGSAADDSGGGFWSTDPFHNRDTLRQSVLDALQLSRIIKSFDERASKQDFDGDGELDMAGDFDADRVPDLGGANVYAAWGQSLGGLITVPLGALDPDITATAPIAGAGSLLDVAQRTQARGILHSLILPALGPLMIGVPAGELEAGSSSCDPDQVSLRFVLVELTRQTQIEFGCFDINEATGGEGLPRGGTVLVTNGANGQRRCARLSPAGRFRVSFPASAGDRLELQVLDEPDVVDSYHPASGCNLLLDARRIALVNTWGSGIIQAGTTDERGRMVCGAANGCTRFLNQYFPAGEPLTAPQSGLGLVRQTPALRRLLGLAQHVLDGADGVNFAPYYGLKKLNDPEGNRSPATGALLIATVGDQDMPIDAQIAVARAMGVVPFLIPGAADDRYPHHADFVTPLGLYQDLGETTPNRMLVTNHVTEGVARLMRQPPSGDCVANEHAPADALECHPGCVTEADCIVGRICDAEAFVCRTPPLEENECHESLFDADAIDEPPTAYGQRAAAVPLRLARVAARATASTIEDRWEPRRAGTPFGPDLGAWQADKRTLALLMPYLDPRGAHGIGAVDPCQSFSMDRYVRHLVGRYFQTQGADLYYLSNPSSHHCLARGDCPFISEPE